MNKGIRQKFVDDQLARSVWLRRQNFSGIIGPFDPEYKKLLSEWDSFTDEEKRLLVSERDIREEGNRNL